MHEPVERLMHHGWQARTAPGHVWLRALHRSALEELRAALTASFALPVLRMLCCAAQWVTSEYMHCGIREAGGAIFEKLLNMARGGTLLR